MAKFINAAVIVVACAAASTALAGGDANQQPSYVNDMPFPSEMPVYTPRVVFGDLPFMELPPFETKVAVFDDMPFPAEIRAYTPVRYFADLPALEFDLPSETDHAALQVDQ